MIPIESMATEFDSNSGSCELNGEDKTILLQHEKVDSPSVFKSIQITNPSLFKDVDNDDIMKMPISMLLQVYIIIIINYNYYTYYIIISLLILNYLINMINYIK